MRADEKIYAHPVKYEHVVNLPPKHHCAEGDSTPWEKVLGQLRKTASLDGERLHGLARPQRECLAEDMLKLGARQSVTLVRVSAARPVVAFVDK